MTYTFREYRPDEVPILDALVADVRRDERIRVLRELAAELEFAAQCADTPDGMPTPWGYSDSCEFSTFIAVFLTRADALEKDTP